MAAIPVIVVVNLIIKGMTSLTSTTYWTEQEDMLLRFGILILLVVINIVVIAVDYVKNPDEWK